MKDAIAILGPPASGKTTLTHPYRDRVIRIGEYAHSLPEDDPLKIKCIEHWEANEVFGPELVQELLMRHTLNGHHWYILDGTPRDAESIPVVEEIFDLRAAIEIRVDEYAWLRRLSTLNEDSRRDRMDSTTSQLLKRRDVYEDKMGDIRHHFQGRIYGVDNSSTINNGMKRFEEALEKALNGLR